MNRWIRTITAVAVIAIAMVVFFEYRESKQTEAWNRLGSALGQANPVEALEIAREASVGTEAEPWIALDLTLALYEEGSLDDLQRAAQVAQSTVKGYPGHPASKLLSEVLPALKSYAADSQAAAVPGTPN
ncbi:MAG: hypothetical protein P8N09_13085 [Planctomycetota bacterium]|jgi:hypothetical protein|nr:hypothetical protein [Planctomycetota bacterium]